MRTIEHYIGQILGTLEDIKTDEPDKKDCIKRLCDEVLEINRGDKEDKE